MIDDIHIHFEEGQLSILNLCLGFLMFGVSLDIDFTAFRKVLAQPKSLAVGLVSQLVLLPLLSLALIYILNPHPSLALGMLLIAACPGGNVSNYAVHISGANTALSVTLTSISTLASALTTPLIFAFLQKHLPGQEVREITLSVWQMSSSLLKLIILPIILGFIFRRYFPGLTQKILPWIKQLSMLIFLSFVVFAVIGNFDNIKNYLYLVFWLVLIHNSLALAMGYFIGKPFGLAERDCQTISIETGIQNSGLGLILVFNFFDGLGGMALITAWWGIWHLLSSFLLARYFKNINNKNQPAQPSLSSDLN